MLETVKQHGSNVEAVVKRNYDVLVSRTADGLENRVTGWVLVGVLPIAGILGLIHLEQIGMQPLPLILAVLTLCHLFVVLDARNEVEYRDNGMSSHD